MFAVHHDNEHIHVICSYLLSVGFSDWSASSMLCPVSAHACSLWLCGFFSGGHVVLMIMTN